MSENDELREGAGDAAQLDPVGEAKEAMRAAVEEFRETVATPRPPERIDEDSFSGEPYRVDLNSATEEELERLPGIGPVLAARIVQHRTEVGPFEDPAEIVAVSGIGASTYEELAGRLVAGPAPALEDGEAAAQSEAPAQAAPVEPEEAEPVEAAPETVEFEEIAESWEEVAEGEDAPEGEDVLAFVPEEEVPPAVEPEPVDWEEEVPLRADLDDLEFEAEPELEEEIGMDLEPADIEAAVVAAAPAEMEDAGFEEVAEVWAETAEPDEAAAVEAAWEAGAPEHVEEAEPVEVATPETGMDAEKRERWPDGEPPLEVVPERRGAGWGGVLLIALLSALVGALLALGTLWIVNRTLDFRTTTDRAVRAEAFRVDGEMAALSADLDGMRGRLEALQELAPRVEQAQTDIRSLGTDLGAIEAQVGQLGQDLASTETALNALSGEIAGLGSEVEALSGDVAGLETQVGAMEEQLTAMQEELDGVRQATERFDGFLTGLRELLDSSALPGEATAATSEETPTPESVTPTPEGETPTPAGETPAPESPTPADLTPTPVPMITVIPLGTPTAVP